LFAQNSPINLSEKYNTRDYSITPARQTTAANLLASMTAT